MAQRPSALDGPRFALLRRLLRALDADGVTDDVRRAVDALTQTLAPDRAERLAVRPGEPPVLVERLAVWALRRVSADAVSAAERVLEGGAQGTTIADRGEIAAPAQVASPSGARATRPVSHC